ncbi:MAG: YebC/PmpR family DNA-binding transcriptional regulator [Bdellovibrionota bacterium]|mgnify:FL=1
MGKGWKVAGMQEKAAQKGKIFTKMAREISVAAKLGGPDPEANSRLKLAIIAARGASVPKDTIERAVKKGSGQLDDGSVIEELVYEGVGPHGIGVIVECQTDNKNRTVSEIRNIFRRHDGNMGETGSVGWMFDRVSVVVAEKAEIGDPEEDAIEAGANEVEKNDDGTYAFIGGLTDLDAIRGALAERGWNVKAAERIYRAKNFAELTGEARKEVEDMIADFEDCDDSQKVYTTLA